MYYDDKVVLTPDSYRLSGVNREAFVDQQEWSLYKHVDTQQRDVTEFIPIDVEEDDETNNEDRKRSILTVTCHAGLYLAK
jgi:hypothetical protein